MVSNVMCMKKLIFASIIIVTILSGVVFYKISFAKECQNVEGRIQLWNGWPPWIRIESIDEQNVFGIETNEEVTQSDFILEALLKELIADQSLTGTFCIKLTGAQATVPYDDRVIKYVKVVSYTIR